MLPLDCEQAFDPAREEEFFSALPARPAVFQVEPWHKGAQPYLLRTADLRRRLERLLRAPDALSKRLNLREFAARIRYRLTGSAFEQSLVHYQHTRALFPRRYRDLTRLRPPALLKVNLANAYPRCYVTRRIVANPAKGQIAGGGPTLARLRRAAPPKLSPTSSSTCSRFAGARSRSGATQAFPAACI